MSETTIHSYFLGNMTNMAGVLKQTGTACPSCAPRFTPFFVLGFLFCVFYGWVRIAHLLSCLCYFVLCLSSSCVLCIQCCTCLWIVHYWLPLRFLWLCVPQSVHNIKIGYGGFQVITFVFLLHVKKNKDYHINICSCISLS